MKLSLIHSKSEKCLEIANILKKKYYFFSEKESDVIVALGGDGFILHSIHKYIAYNQPIFGINCGNLGFLLNSYQQEIDLIKTKNILSYIEGLSIKYSFKLSINNF
jgi:NAD+ kinase